MTAVLEPRIARLREQTTATERDDSSATATAPTFGDRLRTLRGWLAATRGHGVWILLWSIVGWTGTLLSPFLVDNPLVLMLMAPRALFVAMAVDSVNIVVFVLLGTLRLAATDASYFIIGRRFPRSHQRPSQRLRRSVLARVRAVFVRYADALCRWLCDRGIKAGAVLFLRPNGRYLAVAGAYGVSAKIAGWSSVVGTALYLASFHLGLSLIF